MDGYEPTDDSLRVDDEPYSLDIEDESAYYSACVICTGVVIGKICIRCGADQEDYL